MRVREAVVVEGRCDKAKLSALIEGTIVETGGFAIFNDRDKMELIRRLAAKRGVIILTDSDGAGFLIRSKLSQCLPPGQVKHAYIPDIYGKERRKAKPSKEGKLGVEGMTLETLRDCLIRAGAIIEGAPGGDAPQELTKADLFELGLSGGESSADRRKALQRRLKLPERLSANGLLQALRALYTREELLDILENLEGEDTP
jgi:ribonuclease M5